MVFDTSDLHHKWQDTVIVAIHYATREYYSVVRPLAHSSWPVLGAGYCWRVDNKLISLQVKGRSGFEPGDIGSMAKLSLRVTPNFLQGLNVVEPQFVLLVAA